ncbi:hypothetical protein ACNKHW_20490 [Shigella flexneri]
MERGRRGTVPDGDANDYVGKGMAGGLIAIRPPVSTFRSHEASIIGNTCLYGATGGRLYAAGRAGERSACVTRVLSPWSRHWRQRL